MQWKRRATIERSPAVVTCLSGLGWTQPFYRNKPIRLAKNAALAIPFKWNTGEALAPPSRFNE